MIMNNMITCARFLHKCACTSYSNRNYFLQCSLSLQDKFCFVMEGEERVFDLTPRDIVSLLSDNGTGRRLLDQATGSTELQNSLQLPTDLKYVGANFVVA